MSDDEKRYAKIPMWQYYFIMAGSGFGVGSLVGGILKRILEGAYS